MIPLLKHYLWAFFFDENAAKRFLVGLGSLLATILLALLAFGYSTMVAWTAHDWLQHAVFALGSTIAAMLPGPALAKPASRVEPAP